MFQYITWTTHFDTSLDIRYKTQKNKQRVSPICIDGADKKDAEIPLCLKCRYTCLLTLYSSSKLGRYNQFKFTTTVYLTKSVPSHQLFRLREGVCQLMNAPWGSEGGLFAGDNSMWGIKKKALTVLRQRSRSLSLSICLLLKTKWVCTFMARSPF